MCDYSLEAVKSRKAVVGDKLVTKNFGRGTSGFAPADSYEYAAGGDTAVCLLPGTELAFDAPVQVRHWNEYGTIEGVYCSVEHPAQTIEHTVARFAKINQDRIATHHDGLEFPDRFGVDPVLLTNLVEGQTVTVLQMPAEEVPAKAETITAKVPEYVD